ncbi:hypothetical protein TSUD_148980 [Trifolium subterraneum]|uniref:phosphoglycerate mutase (2,3-diphosphoglycerate-dependent) n=1 Tax=Trifolium subterraneum TaxID=3900 RepID=A0A2Z6N5R5_TRISU|nr:hypothetical protein TSUD_148980 [Trifolium subterraneum]
MAAEVCHHAIGTLQSHSYLSNLNQHQNLRSNSLRLVTKDFSCINGLSKGRSSHFGHRNCIVTRSSATHSQTSVVDPVLSPSRNNTSDTTKKSNEAALILIRHGESLWNEKNLFTGCVDVPLSKKGIDEAIEAGKRISSIPVDLIFTSALIRAQMTAMLAMTQHRRKKVPIVMHNESEQAKAWSQVFSEDTKKQSIPVIAAWQLNERMVSINKKQQTDTGKNKSMSGVEAMTFHLPMIEPQLLSGKNVMIAAHGNSLRSIIMYLDKLTSQEVISLELSTGIPMLYISKEGRFIRRGSPIGPTEAGVYAYTKRLALYKQKLDEMF